MPSFVAAAVQVSGIGVVVSRCHREGFQNRADTDRGWRFDGDQSTENAENMTQTKAKMMTH